MLIKKVGKTPRHAIEEMHKSLIIVLLRKYIELFFFFKESACPPTGGAGVRPYFKKSFCIRVNRKLPVLIAKNKSDLCLTKFVEL